MSEIGSALLVFVLLLVATGVGVLVRPLLSEEPKGHDRAQLIQLVIGIRVTFAALVLGLMTASAKNGFDAVSNDFRTYASDLVRLDSSLLEYGADANKARTVLRAYTSAAIASTWPHEPPPAGADYPRNLRSEPNTEELESVELGNLLSVVERDIRALNPSDSLHRTLASDSLMQFDRLSTARWKLIEEAHSSISEPFFVTLTFWLFIIFLSFGLIAPRNALALVTITLGALSLSSVVYGLVDLAPPFTGPIAISSQPMRDALADMSR